MKRIAFTATLLWLILFFVLPSAIAQSDTYSLDINELDAYFAEARNTWNIPGMAVAIVKDNEVVLAKGYGVRNAETDAPADANTVFGIASLSKAFTASALAMLVDEGKISWDDKVVEYIPYFQLYSPYVTQEMTIRDLLCHRAGFKTFSGDLIWYASTHSREEVIRRARYIEPEYGFRSHYGYSNIMFLVAGQIVPAVTGKSWDEFIQERIFTPLEMNRSTTSIVPLEEMDNVAQPHNEVAGENIGIEWVNWDNISPAGGINSSVNDMAQWLILNLSNGDFAGKQLISEEQMWQMQTPHTPKSISGNAAQLFHLRNFSVYGLGWDLFDYNGRKVVNHSGGLDGMISHLMIVPEENLGMVVLTNNNNWLPSALMYQVLDHYFGYHDSDWSGTFMQFKKYSNEADKRAYQEKLAARVENTSPSLELSNYTGTYRCPMYGDVEVETGDSGQLVVKFVPTPAFVGNLTHWHYNTFEIELRNTPALPKGWVHFYLNPDGQVERMEIDIPNPDFHFTELKLQKID